MVKSRAFVFGLAIAAFCLGGGAYAFWGCKNRAGLPHYITIWSGGSADETTFEHIGWFADALKRDYNIILQDVNNVVLNNNNFPNDLNVLDQLMSKKIDFAMVGMPDSYAAQEGLFPFAPKGSPPQPIRLVLQNRAPVLRTLLVQKNSAITSVADLRGKRVPWLIQASEINYMTIALLRYGGLSPDDIHFVPMNLPEEGIKALLAGTVDVAFSPSRERLLYDVARTGFPLRYLPMPEEHGNWKGVQEIAPFLEPFAGTIGAGLDNEHPVQSAGYPFPLLITRADTSADYVSKLADVLLQEAPGQVGYFASMVGWNINKLPLDWTVPYHDGSVEVFKKMGVWTAKHQAYNDRLIERQRVLLEAWKQLDIKSYPDGNALRMAWLTLRENALRKAGFPVGFVPVKEAFWIVR